MKTNDERRARVLVFAAIAAFFVLFFGPTLFSGKFLIAGDAYYQSYPFRSVAWASIRRGELPLWTPYLFSGYPLLSMAQVALGYPLTWGYLFLPGHWAEQIVVLAPFLLAPAFTYLYARGVGLSHFAALFAGLSFTYAGNMSSKLGGLGLAANPELWLPLLLLALERARRDYFPGPLLLATGAYAMSILAGQAQAFLFVGMVALVYGLFLTLLVRPSDPLTSSRSLTRWQPLCVAIGGILLAMGVSAFQILETLPIARLSIRSSLSFEIFTSGSFTASEALHSFLAPTHHYIEVSAYVAPVTFVLAIYGALQFFSGIRDRRILFWLALSIIAFLLMLGPNTPLYRGLFYLPIFNLFRYPSRHAFEWTFALSILAAYGIDALTVAVAHTRKQSSTVHSLIAWSLFVAGLLVAALWWRSAFQHPLESNFGLDSGLIAAQPERLYLLWKFVFTALILPLVWYALKASRKDCLLRVLPVCTISLALFIEPQIFFGHVWFPFAKTQDRFTKTPAVEEWLQLEQAREPQRIYTRVNLFARGYWIPPSLDLPNMTMVRRLENVAGYEQLLLQRYSRALGDVGPDAVNKRYGSPGLPDETLFAEHSHVLDLLNTRHVVTFPRLGTSPEELVNKEGIDFAKADIGHNLLPGETVALSAENAMGDTLALVSALSNSVEVAQGTPVAHLRIISSDGRVVDQELKAGLDTAEWAHQRPDVRALMKHQLARIFEVRPGDPQNGFPAYRYWSSLLFPTTMAVVRVEITNVAREAQLALWKATVYNSVQKTSATLGLKSTLPAAQWRPVKNQDGLVVWRNERALPRAWLVSEVESVDSEEALRRIRGTSQTNFDPRRKALLEVPAAQLPTVNDNGASLDGSAKVTKYTSNSVSIDTDAATSTVLVVSEIFYPGWAARVDGRLTEILPADYLLRAVPLTPGRHTIDMYYEAPGAFKGLIVSALSLLILAALFIYLRRTQRATAS